jgi:hypothetical protein
MIPEDTTLTADLICAEGEGAPTLARSLGE